MESRYSGHFDFPTDLSVRGYHVTDSSNVTFVGWVSTGMLVRFKDDTWYLYCGVTRQRCVAASMARSVGQYINKKIKPRYAATRLMW